MQTLSPLPPPSDDDRTWGMLCHLSGFLSMVVPLGNIIGPLIVWSIKKGESEFIDSNGRSSINFQRTWTLTAVICACLWFLYPLLILSILIYIFLLIRSVWGAIAAWRGHILIYPSGFSFLKSKAPHHS